ncbi:hypothetical protein PENANT_c067G09977 [Penicillium antarcticum]|uniref:SHSP domain-containing protein n=1 Tax=Penicillium antarcticum TaxID=416450 RepID=A0A1V6PPS3_9EURO|nr:uncharacterized protein N7508_011051 [Penicillium antarcticum]KAJ5288276.1 hypothetical protein N7508_011051 [Penicillium antarcticum]OQD78995.1 hypothetical protein PENANT_c067G09977 [Penicillium antarcticum]
MSLFRASSPSSGDFVPLFRLLDDYDTHRSGRSQCATHSFSPRFDVRESESAYHLDGELPGVSQKNIDIEFSDPHTLVVKGCLEREYNSSNYQTEVKGPDKEEEQTKTESKNEPNHHFWASERSVGEFQRTFSFPARVEKDHVKASLNHGILSIQVPKENVTATKKIEIE